jgi:hypothetical protein
VGDGDVDGHKNVVTIDHVLLRSEVFLYKGEMTHVSPLKMDKGDPDITPSLRITNSIFAIEDVNHHGQERLQKAWDKTIESSGNTFLNLSDTPLPKGYPLPGQGWTILQGQAARTYWEAARSKWIEHHQSGDGKPVPIPTPVPNGPVAFDTQPDSDAAANRIAEHAAAGSRVGITASAADPDAGDRVTYSINDSRFQIDAAGVITRSSTGTLNAQSEPTVTLKVTATSTDTSHVTKAFTLGVLSDSQPTSAVSEVRIASSADDVEESASGSVSFTSSDLELVDDNPSRLNQTVGLRFNGLDVPKDAVITRAYVQFQVDETDTGKVALQIRGEDTDNSTPFTSASSNVSSRHTTTATVSWAPPDWTKVGSAGVDQQTADISSIIQEIVSRAGWKADNSLSLIITGSGERTAESYDGAASAAPLLHVEWAAAGTGSSTSGGPAPINAIVGTNASEVLIGTSGADEINGYGGVDRIYG